MTETSELFICDDCGRETSQISTVYTGGRYQAYESFCPRCAGDYVRVIVDTDLPDTDLPDGEWVVPE